MGASLAGSARTASVRGALGERVLGGTRMARAQRRTSALPRFAPAAAARRPYDSLNLGDHVGDAPRRRGESAAVDGRGRLAGRACLAGAGARHDVADLDGLDGTGPADAAVARQRVGSAPFLRRTACPSLLAADTGGLVAAAHAGWRGLAGGRHRGNGACPATCRRAG